MGTEVVNGEISCLKTDCCPKQSQLDREREVDFRLLCVAFGLNNLLKLDAICLVICWTECTLSI